MRCSSCKAVLGMKAEHSHNLHPCKQRSPNRIAAHIFPYGTVTLSFLSGADFCASARTLTGLVTESDGRAISVDRVVVVGIPVVVGIADIRGVACIRRLTPPVVTGAVAHNKQKVTLESALSQYLRVFTKPAEKRGFFSQQFPDFIQLVKVDGQYVQQRLNGLKDVLVGADGVKPVIFPFLQ